MALSLIRTRKGYSVYGYIDEEGKRRKRKIGECKFSEDRNCWTILCSDLEEKDKYELESKLKVAEPDASVEFTEQMETPPLEEPTVITLFSETEMPQPIEAEENRKSCEESPPCLEEGKKAIEAADISLEKEPESESSVAEDAAEETPSEEKPEQTDASTSDASETPSVAGVECSESLAERINFQAYDIPSLPQNGKSLILCEGLSELNYLKGIIEYYGLTECFTVKKAIHSQAPLIVEEAAKEKLWAEAQNTSFKRFYACFDRDTHEDFEETLALAEKFGINVIISNPCIEVWFLMHFVDPREQLRPSFMVPLEKTTSRIALSNRVVRIVTHADFELLYVPEDCLKKLKKQMPGYVKNMPNISEQLQRRLPYALSLSDEMRDPKNDLGSGLADFVRLLIKGKEERAKNGKEKSELLPINAKTKEEREKLLKEIETKPTRALCERIRENYLLIRGVKNSSRQLLNAHQQSLEAYLYRNFMNACGDLYCRYYSAIQWIDSVLKKTGNFPAREKVQKTVRNTEKTYNELMRRVRAIPLEEDVRNSIENALNKIAEIFVLAQDFEEI